MQIEFQYLPTSELQKGLVDLSQYGANSLKNDYVPCNPYRLLVAPCLLVVQGNLPERLQQWIEAGGTLILSFRTGVKTGENAVADASLPGALAGLAGIEVTDYTALLRCDQGEPCGLADGLELTIGGTTHRLATDIWMDELAPRGATVLGRYHRGPYDGAPALTRHRVGNGDVLYVGTALDATGHAVLTEYALALANIASAVRSPDGVEIVPRQHAGVTY